MNPKEYRRQVEAGLQRDAAAIRPAGASIRRAAPDWTGDLDLLSDMGHAPAEREEALWRLQAGTFLVGQFAPYRARYIQALQQLITDANEELRHAAFDVLANFKDDIARQKLAEGLADTSKALVSPAVALGLLARDDHGAATGFARTLLNSAADVATRAQAARVLAADPASGAMLAERLRDTQEHNEVRRASAIALRSLDPARFHTLARDILADGAQHPDIKATLRGSLERDGIATPPATDAT